MLLRYVWFLDFLRYMTPYDAFIYPSHQFTKEFLNITQQLSQY